MKESIEVLKLGLDLQTEDLRNSVLPKTFASKWLGKKIMVTMEEIVDNRTFEQVISFKD